MMEEDGKKDEERKDWLVPRIDFDPFAEDDDDDVEEWSFDDALEEELAAVCRAIQGLDEAGLQESTLRKNYETQMLLMLSLRNTRAQLKDEE
ncbi:MAG: hypothetical protein J6Y62_03260 [Clostridia bacterium]|nr:hypothetical protein [Clostridia bacterium]